MKKIIFIICLFFPFHWLNAQTPTTVFEIENILVDACGNPEGENEMFMFHVGPHNLNTANLSISGAGSSGVITANNWPNTSNLWLGLTQNATTAAKVVQMNSSVTGCGIFKEPLAGVLPAGSKVLLITSTAFNPTITSYAGLIDTVYVIFQTAGNTAGHFVNYTAGTSTRTLVLKFTGNYPWADTVIYHPGMLVMQNGALGAQDGAAVSYSWDGTPHYYNNGCTVPVNTQIFISVSPSLPACQGVPLTFTASVLSGFSNPIYQWHLNGSLIGGNSPSLNITNPINNSVLNCWLIDTNCSVNDTFFSNNITINITAIPGKPGTPVGNSPVCANSTSSISTSGSSNATSYQWYLIPSTAGNLSGTGASTSVTWNSTFTGIARIIVFGVNACGEGPVSDTLQIIVNPSPAKPALPTGPTMLCMNSPPTNYSTTGGANATSYQWSLLPGTAGSITGTGTSSSVSWNATFSGIAKIIVKGVNACGSSIASDTLSVTVSPLPGKPATPTGTTPLCIGVISSNFSTTGGTYATSYHWYILPSTAGTISGTSTNSTVSWAPGFVGIAKIFVNGVNSCGNGLITSDTLFVTINSTPAKPSTPSGLSPLCEGTLTSSYTTSGSTGATTYMWTLLPSSAGTITQSTTTATVSWNSNFSGVAKLIVMGVNNCGNSIISDTLYITVNPVPQKPSIPSGPTSLCVNTQTSTYSTTGGLNTTSYQWNVLPSSSGTISGSGQTATVNWSGTFTGTAKIFVNGINSCGLSTASDTLFVTFNLSPTPNLGNDTSICTGTSLVLSPGVFSSYKWQDSSTTSTYTISSTSPSTNTYWVKVTSNGCVGTDAVTININDCDIDIEIPNVFTPNGDGINDVFTPAKRKGIITMNTSIFNRWGKLIYKTNDLQIGWEGKDYADGVYYWVINYTDITGKTTSINGSITIIR